MNQYLEETYICEHRFASHMFTGFFIVIGAFMAIEILYHIRVGTAMGMRLLCGIAKLRAIRQLLVKRCSCVFVPFACLLKIAKLFYTPFLSISGICRGIKSTSNCEINKDGRYDAITSHTTPSTRIDKKKDDTQRFRSDSKERISVRQPIDSSMRHTGDHIIDDDERRYIRSKLRPRGFAMESHRKYWPAFLRPNHVNIQGMCRHEGYPSRYLDPGANIQRIADIRAARNIKGRTSRDNALDNRECKGRESGSTIIDRSLPMDKARSKSRNMFRSKCPRESGVRSRGVGRSISRGVCRSRYRGVGRSRSRVTFLNTFRNVGKVGKSIDRDRDTYNAVTRNRSRYVNNNISNHPDTKTARYGVRYKSASSRNHSNRSSAYKRGMSRDNIVDNTNKCKPDKGNDRVNHAFLGNDIVKQDYFPSRREADSTLKRCQCATITKNISNQIVNKYKSKRQTQIRTKDTDRIEKSVNFTKRIPTNANALEECRRKNNKLKVNQNSRDKHSKRNKGDASIFPVGSVGFDTKTKCVNKLFSQIANISKFIRNLSKYVNFDTKKKFKQNQQVFKNSKLICTYIYLCYI